MIFIEREIPVLTLNRRAVYNNRMVSGILLAAGLSRRFGSPKALARLNGRTVIEHLQQRLADSKLSEVIVVLGANAELIKPHVLKHTKVRHVYNKDYNLGQTSSFKTGLREISAGSQGVMLLPVDCPFVTRDTIDRLIGEFIAARPEILIPTYENHRGHPPVFHVDLKESILGLDDKVGLNAFEHQHGTDIRLYPVSDETILQTFNTPEEFETLKQKNPDTI